MLISTYFAIAEVKQPHIQLLLKSATHFLLPQLIVELVAQRLGSIQALFGRVYHQLRDEIEKQGVCLGEELLPLSFLHFGELVIVEVVLRIHIDDLSLRGRSQHLNDLD